ncbi:MAG: hypothetical protein GXP62_17815 [Oligoflexia bacterium]|nr:hypothetical protein [Oligoflexia bacterium]
MQVAAGSILAGMLISEGALESARGVCTAVSKAATARGHWVAVAGASIDLAAVCQLSGDLEAAVQNLLSTTITLRQRGALTAANLVIARLSEMRAEQNADGASERFTAALRAATAA